MPIGTFQKVTGILLGIFTWIQEKNSVLFIEILVQEFGQ